MQRLYIDEPDWTNVFMNADYEQSFYVGDAAGRAGDHNDTDRSTSPFCPRAHVGAAAQH